MLTAMQATLALVLSFDVRADRLPPNAMPVMGTVAAPKAFLDFCARVPADCSAGRISDNRVELEIRHWAMLEHVNARVNALISPQSDQSTYGVGELWALPVGGRGDCEDYALLKRHVLIRQGWPAGAVLMTIVVDGEGEGHAVLTIRTDRGDLVLDNKEQRILLWHQTPYRYVMRQSFANPMQWMALGRSAHGAGVAAVAASGRR